MVIQIVTVMQEPPVRDWNGSSALIGAWLQENVTRTTIALYAGSILVHEGYADRVPGQTSKIRFPERADITNCTSREAKDG